MKTKKQIKHNIENNTKKATKIEKEQLRKVAIGINCCHF